MSLTLNTALRELPGVGQARAKALAKLGLETAGDLLAWYPRGYEDRRQFAAIASAPADLPVCLEVMVAEEPRLSYIRKGLELVKVRLVDDTGSLTATFFNQTYMKNALRRGESYIVYGKVEGLPGRRQMTNPVCERADRARFTGCILPVYPLTKGISNNLMAALARRCVEGCAGQVEETLPQALRQEHALAGVEFACRNIHFPADEEALALARRRLIFEELFSLTCGLALLRTRRDGEAGPAFSAPPMEQFLSLLPFSLTGAQRRTMEEMAADMAAGPPMNRLVQGDVGSGKTMVAAWGAWLAAKNGYQCALMAPTELLAEQHFRSLSPLLEQAGLRTGLLTGAVKGKARKELLSALAGGEIDLIIGTHALLSDGVAYARLGLVVTDEQHRFGVAQRAALAAKAWATPGAPSQTGRRASGEGRGDSLPPAANEIGLGAPALREQRGDAQRAALAAKAWATPGAPSQTGRRASGEGRGDSLPPAANEIGLGAPALREQCGDAQRAALAAKAQNPPHVLVLSATPIPRTLSLAIYGDLDVSVIDELPPGRSPVETYIIGESKRQRMYGFVRRLVGEGRQAYIVCPAVEEAEEPGPEDCSFRGLTEPPRQEDPLKAAVPYARQLQEEVFPDLRVGLVHGKMKPREKDAVMAAFARGELDVLVSTTVIEVGVDVPNAALMVVENADRFGLSQLHQLRGRVGRGKHQSYCVLVTGTRSPESMERLRALKATNDGFQIAEEDLRLRGPGDFFGRRQHGLPQLRVADLAGDMRVLKEAQQAARALLEADPGLRRPEHAPLLGRVRKLFADHGDMFN